MTWPTRSKDDWEQNESMSSHLSCVLPRDKCNRGQMHKLCESSGYAKTRTFRQTRRHSFRKRQFEHQTAIKFVLQQNTEQEGTQTFGRAVPTRGLWRVELHDRPLRVQLSSAPATTRTEQRCSESAGLCERSNESVTKNTATSGHEHCTSKHVLVSTH